MKINTTQIQWFFVFIAIFSAYLLFSLFFSDYSTEGDQFFYRNFYNGIQYEDLIDGYEFYQNSLSASEPVYYIIIWLFSRFLEKNIFISMVNALLGVLFFDWLRRKNTHWLIMGLLSLNFYLLVMFFSAERLKFGYLFLLLSQLSTGWFSYSFSIVSILSHLQMLVLYSAELISQRISTFAQQFKRTRSRSHMLYWIMSMLIGLTSLLFIITVGFPLVQNKILGYIQQTEVNVSNKIVFFLILSLLYSKNKWRAFIAQVILLLTSFMVGDHRIVILSFTIFLTIGLDNKRGLNLGVLFTSGYFFVKGILLLWLIYQYNDAFPILFMENL